VGFEVGGFEVGGFEVGGFEVGGFEVGGFEVGGFEVSIGFRGEAGFGSGGDARFEVRDGTGDRVGVGTAAASARSGVEFGDETPSVACGVDLAGMSAASGVTGKVYRLSLSTDRPWKKSASVNPLTVRITAPTVRNNATIALVRVVGFSPVRNAPINPARIVPSKVAVGPAPKSPGTTAPNTLPAVVSTSRHEYIPACRRLALLTLATLTCAATLPTSPRISLTRVG
jgi:hypothetical protein